MRNRFSRMANALRVRGWSARGWAPLIVVLCVAVCARAGITYLHHSAEAHLQEETTLVRIDGYVHRLRHLEGQARQPDPAVLSPGDREWADERAAGLADARAGLDVALADLARVDPDNARTITAAANRFFTAVTELGRLEQAGLTAEADAWDAANVDPAFTAWDRLVEDQADAHGNAAARAAKQADTGTAVSLIVAAVVAFLIFRHVERVRRTAAVLAGERRAEAKFRTLVEQLPAITYIQIDDHKGTTAYSSPQTEAVSGWPVRAFLDDPEHWITIAHPDDRDRVLAANRHADETGEPFHCEYRQRRPDGEYRWIRDEAVRVAGDGDEPSFWLGVITDVTALKESQEAVRASEEQFRLLFAANPHPMWLYDRETLCFLEVNDAAVAHYGYTRDEFLAMSIADIRPTEDVPALLASLARERPALQDDHGWRHLTKDGRLIDVDITSHVLTLGGRSAVLLVAQDVTARLAVERQLAHQAFHDPLTALPNRALFLDRLGHALERARRHGGGVAVLFLDLDDFKVVNDTLGHEAGDRLLVAVAERLRGVLRPEDTLARLGGDEFTVLLEDLATPADARRVAERLAAALRPSFRLDGRDVLVNASLGIATPPSPEETPDDLLRLADVAMYEAKHRGKDRVAVFDVGMDARAWQRLELEAELRRAIDEGQLRLHYQPLVDLVTGQVVEIEALVRWQHPERGVVPPGDFIPLAEETGLIVPLGRWVLEQACREAAAWQRLDPAAAVGVAVNLSARQFRDAGLVDDVALALAKSGLDPARLKLEITETAAMEDAPSTVAAMRALKELGVRLAIDDFGAGYSGLAYLRRCPVDALKIDRGYVAGLGRDAADAAMVRAVVAFARTLELGVTAEGVETEAQLAELLALGCECGQGFLFARPLPIEDMLKFLDGSAAVAPMGLRAAD